MAVSKDNKICDLRNENKSLEYIIDHLKDLIKHYEKHIILLLNKLEEKECEP